jgi:hypothetical protein
VSTALGELARERRLRRVDDGTWLLTGDPVGEPVPANLRRIPPRRRLFARGRGDAAAAAPLVEHAVAGDSRRTHEVQMAVHSAGELRARLRHLRLESDRMRAELRGACATSTELCRRIHDLRRQRAQGRERAYAAPET